jgi:hypothetical protein
MQVSRLKSEYIAMGRGLLVATDMRSGLIRDEEEVVRGLGSEIELGRREALLYLKILREGGIPRAKKSRSTEILLSRGMILLSGDGKRFIALHPRLGIANYFRTYQEQVARELRERRMRVDKLILTLIPVYEATTEKRLAGQGGK